METGGGVFGKPYNWCDRRCERCPLEERCDLTLHEKRQRWQDEARGLDPDDPERMAEHMAQDLERSMKLLEIAAEEDGIDLDAPAPPRVTVLAAKRLEHLALDVVSAMAAGDALGKVDHPSWDEAQQLLTKLATKCARIASHLDIRADEREVWQLDGEPNLLLIEHVRRELERELRCVQESPDVTPVFQDRAKAALAALAPLDAQLAPLFARVGAGARASLAQLIASGDAPSPFRVKSAESEQAVPGPKSRRAALRLV